MKKINFIQNTLQGTLWGVGNKLIAVLFPFILRTTIIKKLGAEYAGLNSLFTSILQVLSLADLGFSSAMVYSMYKPVAEEDMNTISALLNFFRKIYISIGCIILVIGLAIMPFINKMISGEIPTDINIYILYLIYLFNTVSSYLFFAYRTSILSAYQKEAEISKIQMIANIIMCIIQITVLIIFTNYYIYIVFLPIFTCISNYMKYYYVKMKYPQICCKGNITYLQREIIKKNVSALFLHKLGSVTVNTLDNIVISSILGLVLLSNYNNYYYLVSAVTSLILIFFNSITAGIGNRIIIDSIEANRCNFYKIFYINGIIVSVSTVCFFSSFQDFIVIWLGKQYLFDFLTMILMCSYFYVHTIRRTVISYRDAAGMWLNNKWQPVVSAIVNLVLNIILIQVIGIKGVILSTIISMLIIDIPWESKKLIQDLFNMSTKKYYKRMSIFALITFTSCIIMFMIMKALVIANINLKLVVEFLLSLIVGSVFFVLLTFRMSEFREVSKKIISICKFFKT